VVLAAAGHCCLRALPKALGVAEVTDLTSMVGARLHR